MTEQRRSRRPSSARKPSAAARAGAGTEAPDGALQTLDDPEPSLGEVKFDEWFETPVFESDSDERLEELATSRRGPLRLAASTFLRLNARADQMRRRSDQPDPSPATDPADVPLDRALPAGPPEPTPAPSVTRSPRPRANGAGGPRLNGTTAKAKAKANGTTPKANGTTPKANGTTPKANGTTPKANDTTPKANGTTPRANGTTPRANGTTPKANGAHVAAPRANGTATRSGGTTRRSPRPATRKNPAQANGTPPPPPESAAPAPEGGPGLRQRLNAALDRWAEREAATQTRIERLLLPKRWQG